MLPHRDKSVDVKLQYLHAQSLSVWTGLPIFEVFTHCSPSKTVISKCCNVHVFSSQGFRAFFSFFFRSMTVLEIGHQDGVSGVSSSSEELALSLLFAPSWSSWSSRGWPSAAADWAAGSTAALRIFFGILRPNLSPFDSTIIHNKSLLSFRKIKASKWKEGLFLFGSPT